MQARWVAVPVAVLGVCAALAANAAPKADPRLARGRYLTDNVGMCSDCHSPRTASGEPDRSHWLQGAEIGFAPLHPMPAFAKFAPGIAGLANWSEADAVRLLETGIGRDGKPLAPPMPPYRLTRQDAEAVVAYLKSLPAS